MISLVGGAGVGLAASATGQLITTRRDPPLQGVGSAGAGESQPAAVAEQIPGVSNLCHQPGPIGPQSTCPAGTPSHILR